MWGSAGCACGDVGNAGVVLLRFDDLYQAAAAFSIQKFRNRAVFSGSMLTEIRFQENTRLREAALCTHKSAVKDARGLCPSPPSPSLAFLHNLAKTGWGSSQTVGGMWLMEECSRAH